MSESTKTAPNRWVLGARVPTLPAAVVPVLVGTGVAVYEDGFVWWKALLTLVVSLAMQVGVNYANDYSDGIRGTDDKRLGPPRLVAGGLARPAEVKRAAFACFGIAALAGLLLALTTALWLVVLGAACIAAAWGYTGGQRPYGYRGLGELAVFVFFGLVAVMGTTFVQTEEWSALSFWAAIPVGSLAVALLVVNNLRDREGDALAGKRTLAVRLGDQGTRRFYGGIEAVAFVVIVGIAVSATPFAVLGLVGVFLARRTVRSVLQGVSGRDLVPVLKLTARTQLVVGAGLTVGLLLGSI